MIYGSYCIVICPPIESVLWYNPQTCDVKINKKSSRVRSWDGSTLFHGLRTSSTVFASPFSLTIWCNMLLPKWRYLEYITLARAHVLAKACYELVALGHRQVQHLPEQRINNIPNLTNHLFTYYIELEVKHRWLASCYNWRNISWKYKNGLLEKISTICALSLLGLDRR